MPNALDDRAEAQWTMVSSLTAVAAQRRARNPRPGVAGIDTLRRFLGRRRLRTRFVLSKPLDTTPPNGDAPCTHC